MLTDKAKSGDQTDRHTWGSRRGAKQVTREGRQAGIPTHGGARGQKGRVPCVAMKWFDLW